ncbi:MAG: hypothetical protein RSB61_06300, partial [Clostridia bacterium]
MARSIKCVNRSLLARGDINKQKTVAFLEELGRNLEDVEDDEVEELVAEKIKSANEALRGLIFYYTEKRRGVLDMPDIELSQTIFAKYCNKLKMLDKSVASAKATSDDFEEFCTKIAEFEQERKDSENQNSEANLLENGEKIDEKDGKSDGKIARKSRRMLEKERKAQEAICEVERRVVEEKDKEFLEKRLDELNSSIMECDKVFAANPRMTDAFTLNDDFCNLTPRAYILNNAAIKCREWKSLYLIAIKLFFDCFKDEFRDILLSEEMNKEKKINFAETKNKMQRPYFYKDANLFVETNYSPNEIRNRIIKMANNLYIDENLIRIKACKEEKIDWESLQNDINRNG